MVNPGDYIGNYRVISQLSSDPFSHVYLAEHTFTAGPPVVIKLWPTIRINSAQEYNAFVQEAQRIVTLRHPHILPLIDFGVDRDSPYIVTGYDSVTSGSLRDRIRYQSPHPFPLQEALTILSQVGQALCYAHQQNVIHRQLKPEYIHFNAQGEVSITDFGFSTIINANQHADVPGTDPYMAPLPLQGTTSKLSDQYALGCIAYELLTGYQPSQNPLPPTQLNPSLPISVEKVILKAMAKEPADRHRDVGAFISALSAAAISQNPAITVTLNQVNTPSQTLAPQQAEMVTLASTAAVQTPDSATASSTLDTRKVFDKRNPRPRLKRPQRFALIALISLLVIGLVASLAPYLFAILPASAATVTITPTSRHLANSYTINAVTGTPDPSQRQVQARLLSYTTPTKSKTVKATGYQAATTARGKVTISPSTGTVPAGYLRVPSNSGVYVIINVLSPISSGSQTFDAWAENAGSRGNIPAYDIDHLYNMVNDPSIVYYLQNTQAFSGGQDAYTFVQQSDIDDATNDLQTQLTNDAQTAVQKQIQGDEQTIGGISCNSKTSANHRANDKAADVTVKVSVTCKAEVYSPQEIQSMAAALLKSDATTQLGGDYLLVDYVLTGTPTLLTTGNDGTASFSVKAEGIWVFQFNDARKQQVAHSITGKSQADTKAFLLKQPGIRKVSIVTSGGWGSALPTSPHAIKFIVVNVPGLQAT